MTSMEDLISTISGGMHVSQDGYDLKALQEYLSRTIALPGLQPLSSPTIPFHALPTSRSTSTTRKPHSYFDLPNTYQTYPYPSHQTNTYGQSASAEDVTQQTPQRPNLMKRSSSYGYGEMTTEFAGESGFEGDAFAPLWQKQSNVTAGPSDPWGIGIGVVKDQANPWSGFGGNASVFGKGKGQGGDDGVQVSIQERGVSESEDEGMEMEMEMDEDGVEDMMGMEEDEEEDEEEERVERAMGLGGGNGLVQQGVGKGGEAGWNNGAVSGNSQSWNGFDRGRARG